MKKNKKGERRLREIRSMKVSRVVVSTFIMILGAGILCIAALACFIVGVVQREFDRGSEALWVVHDVINSGGLTEDAEERLDFVSEMNRSVRSICVFDDEGGIVYARNTADIPDLGEQTPFLGVSDTGIICNDSSSAISYNSGIKINWDKAVEVMEAARRFSIREEDIGSNADDVVLARPWLITKLGDGSGSVCIQYDITVRNTDLGMIVVITITGMICLCAYALGHVINAVRDIHDRRRIIEFFYTDQVTGGRNKEGFIRDCGRLMKQNRQLPYAVALINMEKYSSYNTCYGTEQTEELLSKLYGVISSSIVKKETVGRLTKGDFALMLTYGTPEEIPGRIEKIMIKMANVYPDRKIYFTSGIYIFDRNSDTDPDPDRACSYAAAARGSLDKDGEKRIAVFSDVMYQDQLWRRKVENDMERAADNGEFVVYLQPKYSTGTEVLSGAEALVRWQHPTEGFIPPYKFVPIFEQNGFITRLDDYMLTEVARQQAKWIAEGKKVVPVSVNVSRAHFTREDLAEHICGIVDDFKVPHKYIELELTESAFFDDKETLIRIVNKMKSYGFAVSMDDFGAGYSSLNSLKELPLDVVKLDAEFFRGDDAEGRGKVIVEEAINLAKKLDMRIVAEGIETREQVDFLADQKCDLIQGYYFAKPMPIEEFEKKAFGEGEESNG